MARAGTIEDVLARVSPEPNTGCWLWTGKVDRHGYGVLRLDGSRQVAAHRLAYELLRGPIGPGLELLHMCDTPSCVNAETHLVPGTHLENMQDKVAKGRSVMPPPRRKLTEDQVAEIRASVAAGGSRRALARRFGVDRTTVRDIVNGKKWRDALPRGGRSRPRSGAKGVGG